MGVNSSVVLVGIAKQTAKGAPASVPTYWHGVASGAVAEADISQAALPLTGMTSEPSAVERTAVATGQSYTCPAWPGPLGLLLLGIYGSIVTTGSGPSYTHTPAVGSNLPYFTLWGMYGSGNYFKLPDAQLDELELSWKGTEALDCKATFLSAGISFPVSVTATELIADFFRPGGGTFKVDVGSATPVDVDVTGGTFKWSRSLEAVRASRSVVPVGTDVKALDPTIKLTVMPTDLSMWRTILTGSANGSTISEAAVYGSFLSKFVCGSDELTISGSKVAFLTKLPDADPKGGTAEVDLDGTPVRPDATTPAVQAVLKNTVASY